MRKIWHEREKEAPEGVNTFYIYFLSRGDSAQPPSVLAAAHAAQTSQRKDGTPSGACRPGEEGAGEGERDSTVGDESGAIHVSARAFGPGPVVRETFERESVSRLRALLVERVKKG